MQSNITACSTAQSANHLHHRGDEGGDGGVVVEERGDGFVVVVDELGDSGAVLGVGRMTEWWRRGW